MLLTTCSNCQAQFKVTPEQLNIRQGRVMCGRCRSVFNAFQSLERVGDEVLSTTAPLKPLSDDIESSGASAAIEFPTLTLAGKRKAMAPGGAEQSDRAEESGEPPAVEPLQAPIEVVTIASDPDPVPSVAQENTARESGRKTLAPYPPGARQDTITLTPPSERRRVAWGLGALLALLFLLVQAAYFMRTELVSNYPGTRAYFAKVCEAFGCTVSWSRDENALKVESSDLIEEIGKPGHFLLTATISNRSKTVQDYPDIELTLTDTNNQTLTRRVLRPADYLGRPMQRDEGMLPASETHLNLRLESSSERAAGYHLLLFYP
jgi:predicted Zn finger-like uncharacterized protein